MGVCERNSLVANRRWTRVHDLEHARIRTDEQAMCMKAALCGFLAGDGNVVHRVEETYERWQITFFPDDQNMLHTFKHFISSIYNKKLSITKEINFYSVQLTSKSTAIDLLELGCFSTHDWVIPEFVMNTRYYLIAWIRAFYSAEAYVSNEVIRVQTVNHQGMKQLSEAFKSLDIVHRTYTFTPKNKNHSQVHILIISNYAMRRRYAKLIGFWHDNKTRTLSKALHSKTNT